MMDERVGQTGGGLGATGLGGQGGIQIWAKITGNAAGTNRYDWSQIDESDTSAFGTATLAPGFAPSGTNSTTGWCAREINGLTTVPTGTKVRLTLAETGEFWIFEYAPAGSLSGGGDLTLRTYTVDNSGTYKNTGWSMSLPSAGTYLLFANLTASLMITTFGAFTPEWISVRLYDGSAVVSRSTFMAVSAYVTATNYTQSMGFMTTYAATGATTIALQAKTRGGSTIAGASIWSGSPVDDPTSDIRYLKIG